MSGQEKCAVQELSAWAVAAVDRAHQDRRSDVGGECAQPLQQVGVSTQEDGGRGLRPQHDPRSLVRCLAGQPLVDVHDLRVARRIPLDRLLDRGLDHRHVDTVRGRDRPAERMRAEPERGDQQQRGRHRARPGPTRAEGQHAGKGRVHRRDHE